MKFLQSFDTGLDCLGEAQNHQALKESSLPNHNIVVQVCASSRLLRASWTAWLAGDFFARPWELWVGETAGRNQSGGGGVLGLSLRWKMCHVADSPQQE